MMIVTINTWKGEDHDGNSHCWCFVWPKTERNIAVDSTTFIISLLNSFITHHSPKDRELTVCPSPSPIMTMTCHITCICKMLSKCNCFIHSWLMPSLTTSFGRVLGLSHNNIASTLSNVIRGVRGAVSFGFDYKSYSNREIKMYVVRFG
jgi:hypothetical protein